MRQHFSAFFQRFTFKRQIGISITLGILFLALFASIAGSWQVNERVREDLISQGRRITDNLAKQSTLALIYSSADNATEVMHATMSFPGVIGMEIRHANGDLLLAQGDN